MKKIKTVVILGCGRSDTSMIDEVLKALNHNLKNLFFKDI